MAHDGRSSKTKDGHHQLSHSRSKQAKRMLSFMEPSPALTKPILTGYMFKQSHILDVFNKRFFVLYPGYLVYYVKMHDWNSDVAKNTLQHRHGAIKLTRLYLSKPEKKPRGGRFCFILHTPDKANRRHEILLVTKTREERREWMILLQQQNPHLVPGQNHVPPDTPVPPRRKFITNAAGSPAQSRSPPSPRLLRSESSEANSHAHEPGYDPELDHDELPVHDGLSDHEDHEPDEDSPTEDFVSSGSPNHRRSNDAPKDIRFPVPTFDKGRSPHGSPRTPEKQLSRP